MVSGSGIVTKINYFIIDALSNHVASMTLGVPLRSRLVGKGAVGTFL